MNAIPRDASDTLVRIERMLHERIGLDPSTVGSSLVHRAVARRMISRGITTAEAYAAVLGQESREVQELVELVVVPETYFFREMEGLEAVAQRAASGPHRATEVSPARVLSAPCSTGEEPYSIAMTMLSAGVPAAAIAVDAVDVSLNAVHRAQAAIYGRGSFRRGPEAFRHYFHETIHGLALRDDVRALVRVEPGNLLDPAFHAPRSSYDYIFCRNLLIYFDTDAQTRVLATLTALLAPDGVLAVAAADTFAVRRAGMIPVAGAERAFLFQCDRRQNDTAPNAEPAKRAASPRRRTRNRLRAEALGRPHTDSTRPAPLASQAVPAIPAAVQTGATSPLVAEIARLAGVGRLVDAVRLGERAIAEPAADGELLALMGTTYAALQNDTRAEACYRQALYLDPSQTDALVHLALLVERRGDKASAARLRARARRSIDDAPGERA